MPDLDNQPNGIKESLMGSKVKMDTATRQKCNKIIASAAAAAGLAGVAPIPLADTIPITAAQIRMVIALGKVFDFTISESAAKSVLSIMTAQTVGRTVFANLIKAIPGAGTIVGGVVASATASAITTALGKVVSEDFYKISVGEQPDNISAAAKDLGKLFSKNYITLK